MSRAPSAMSVISEPSETALVPPSSGAEHSSQGVGDGWGSAPTESPGPASGESPTARTSVRARASFFNVVSPLWSLRTGIARKLSGYFTPNSLPQSHGDEAEGLTADRALFVRLYREGRIDEARALCADRMALLETDDPTGRVAWACNFTVLLRDGGDNAMSIALLRLVKPFAADAHPLTRARFHNGLGRSYELAGNLTEAISEYEKAAPLFIEGGHAWEIAKPLFSIGRVKASEGKVGEARMYLDRAARIAIDAGDYRLLGEIAEEGAKP